ncbi:hypothetical protein MST27_05035 [Pseudomonas sp. PS1]|uniref:Uncharacterized protein n=1 Tax=Stutzerimonas marianensis TaxID=2929513 RepID=A0A9X1W0C9_9GAMM|nr:hypothetical protein [Pseudomonas marianensis]MCJ0972731.1 hypothetical protein [Pseudomonas marianensis]
MAAPFTGACHNHTERRTVCRTGAREEKGMKQVLVDRELLESLAELGEDAINRMGSYLAEKHGEQRYVDAARAILAQPAEAEGVEVVAWQQRYICPDEGPSCWQSADERTVEILRRRDDYELRQLVPLAALSAVTAERDRLRDANASRSDKLNEAQSIIEELRAEVEALRSYALIGTDAYRATVYVLRRAACDEVFGVAKLQRIFLLDWQSAERLLKEMVRRGDVEQCAGHGWKFPDAAMAAKEA